MSRHRWIKSIRWCVSSTESLVSAYLWTSVSRDRTHRVFNLTLSDHMTVLSASSMVTMTTEIDGRSPVVWVQLISWPLNVRNDLLPTEAESEHCAAGYSRYSCSQSRKNTFEHQKQSLTTRERNAGTGEACMQICVSTSVMCGLERMQMKVFMWEAEGGAIGHRMREKSRKADRSAIVCAHVAL